MSFGGLYPSQLDAVHRMHNGCILCGGVGSGKSITSLSYYFRESGCDIDADEYKLLPKDSLKDLYIITTARKRDTREWEDELGHWLLSTNSSVSYYTNKVVVDSWNNIGKYCDVSNAFFIFDEQRVVGRGAWAKSFIKITRKNKWILLSATPADNWMDYIPVFVANGFYKNRTQFLNEHVIYRPNSKYPVVDKFINEGRLIRLRNITLINMDKAKTTESVHEEMFAEYNKELYKFVWKNKFNIYKNKPIENSSEYCSVLRQLINSDESRQQLLLEICEDHPRVIVFYNYDFELEILRSMYFGDGVEVAEYNGHHHQPIPDTEKWVYLVQYTSGAEGWNCIKTNAIAFYSQNYSYRIMTQAAGRIDRLNTSYNKLYYYHIKSRAPLDLAISRALRNKKKFNESQFTKSAKWG